VQLDRARSAVRAAREWGDSDDDLRLLDADEVADIAGVAGTLGATYTPHCAVTPHATVRADVVVRATEAYTAALPGARRDLAPVYSLIVATEPLPPETLEAVGLSQRPTFADHRHMVCYGQRTADGRIVFGGRGAPYHYGSRTRSEFDLEPGVFDSLQRTLLGMFPAL